ncbi:hypothetical protein ACFLVZ_00635 [Chloroflexota bacterium]
MKEIGWIKFLSTKGVDIGEAAITAGFFLLAIATSLTFVNLGDFNPENLIRWLLGLTLGLFSIGLGAISIGLSGKSDRKMQAIADFHLESNLVSLKEYIQVPWHPGLVKPLEVKAVFRLIEWASDDNKDEFRQIVATIISLADSNGEKELAEQVKGYRMQFNLF